MTVLTSVHPEWLDWPIPEDENTAKKLYQILNFFLIHAPCYGQSNRWNNIEGLWGPYPWVCKNYLKRRLNQAISGVDICILGNVDRKADLEDAFCKANLTEEGFYTYLDEQRVRCLRASGKNRNLYMSFFYHLRNALAHGRFAICESGKKGQVFIFEDGQVMKKEMAFSVTTRGVIYFDSLVNIIDVIKKGPDTKPDIEQLILQAIESGVNTKKTICKELEIQDNDWRIYIGCLRSEGKVNYKKNHWVLT